MNKRFFSPLLKFGLEQEEIFEDSQNGVAVNIMAKWIDSPPAFVDGYFTIASPKNKYCLYYGEKPNLDGYKYIQIDNLIEFNYNGHYSNRIKDIELDWDFIPSVWGYREFLFTCKLQGIPLETPIGYGDYAGTKILLSVARDGVNSTIKPKYSKQLEISTIKNLTGEFYLKLKKEDVIFEYGYIRINRQDNQLNHKKIQIVSFSAKIGCGKIDLDPIVNYPSSETNNTNPFFGFRLRDKNNIVNQYTDFEYIELSYNIDITSSNIYTTNFVKNQHGKNIISTHAATTDNIAHAVAMKGVFLSIYPNFSENYIDTNLDELTPSGIPSDVFFKKYIELRESDILFAPYVNGATSNNRNSSPNFLIVSSHYNNDFVRHDITSSSDEFLNTIAVNSCTSTGTPQYGTCTSFGYGVEFSEDLVLLQETYPLYNAASYNPIYQESATCAVVAAKLKKIKIDSGATWSVVREAARKTAYNPRNIGGWDIYMGFGIINVEDAKQWILDNYTNNVIYRSELADKLEADRGIPYDLQFSDLLPNSPVSKKMIEEVESNKIKRYVVTKTFTTNGSSYMIYADQEDFPLNSICVNNLISAKVMFSYSDTNNFYKKNDNSFELISGDNNINKPANWFINPNNYFVPNGTEITLTILIETYI